jgi:hypothetical protein
MLGVMTLTLPSYANFEVTVNPSQISPINEYKLFLYEESVKQGLSYADFSKLREAIRRESNWIPTAYHKNKNKTEDNSLAQINSCWEKYAKENGYEFYKSDWRQNLQLAVQIYKIQGIKAWTSMRYK